MILFGNKKLNIFIFLCLSLFFFKNNLFALENRILFKINNSIITSLDIENETIYIKTFNKNTNKLSNNDIYNIAKKNLIRDKIKEIEILKFVKKIQIDRKYLDELIKSTYLKLGFESKSNFLKFIKLSNLNIDMIEKKISVQILWNQLIVSKFSNKVKINENDLKNKILKNKNRNVKNYLLSEILFNVSQNDELKIIQNKINQTIKDEGFENAVLIYSISDTSKNNGKLGWVKENMLSPQIKKELENTKVGETTNPIITPGGFLILKVEEIKLEKIELDLDKELKALINLERNKQLNQRSNIYFNKIKKDYYIDEF